MFHCFLPSCVKLFFFFWCFFFSFIRIIYTCFFISTFSRLLRCRATSPGFQRVIRFLSVFRCSFGCFCGLRVGELFCESRSPSKNHRLTLKNKKEQFTIIIVIIVSKGQSGRRSGVLRLCAARATTTNTTTCFYYFRPSRFPPPITYPDSYKKKRTYINVRTHTRRK